VGQGPEAVPPSGQVQAERGQVLPFQQAVVPPRRSNLASCARSREPGFSLLSPPGHRLQSLLCVWTI
jgi:hypothetical protein